MKVRLTNITIDADVDMTPPTAGVPPVVVVPPIDPPALPPDPGPGPSQLPIGWDTDLAIGLYMLKASMDAAGLTPVGVQHHGPEIVAAMKASYPGWDVYLSPTDSPIVPHWGSLDVTVNSGLGGWSFRPDGYFAWKPAGQR